MEKNISDKIANYGERKMERKKRKFKFLLKLLPVLLVIIVLQAAYINFKSGNIEQAFDIQETMSQKMRSNDENFTISKKINNSDKEIVIKTTDDGYEVTNDTEKENFLYGSAELMALDSEINTEIFLPLIQGFTYRSGNKFEENENQYVTTEKKDKNEIQNWNQVIVNKDGLFAQVISDDYEISIQFEH